MLGEYLMLWDIVLFIVSTFFRIDGFWLYNVKNTDLNKYLADSDKSMFRAISETVGNSLSGCQNSLHDFS